MPVLNGARAWLETSTTLKVPEHAPTNTDNVASSYVAARPGEVFSLRYDHILQPDFDMAWKLTITADDDTRVVEQWGGPPLEMRKTPGIVKVRAMRISEDGRRFREFAWPSEGGDPSALKGTITLSIHLCHFAEATVEVPPAPAGANVGAAPEPNKEHPVLAPPTTRPTASKLWTWYWRDEEPQAVFKFRYAPKEHLQAEGIIPVTSSVSKVSASPKMAFFKGHRPRMSTDVDVASPAGLLRHKQSLNVRNAWNWRNRGLSVSSDQSDISTGSSGDSEGGSDME